MKMTENEKLGKASGWESQPNVTLELCFREKVESAHRGTVDGRALDKTDLLSHSFEGKVELCHR
ncbi:hypothetical protein ACVDG8_037425 (plasmid) [Mesorhizobium sp. ORM8.1]